MEKIKVIKTEKEYKEALKLIAALIQEDPDPNSEKGEKLSLLSTLVKDYESSLFPESLPDPVEAILFRMEQQNLQPHDLVPYLGSSSRVSEILSRKRPLSISMMRALEKGLGIPARVLLKEPDDFENPLSMTWGRFPWKEMERRRYFGTVKITEQNIRKLLEGFFRPVGSFASFAGLMRKTNYIRSSRQMDKYALLTWSGQVIKEAKTMGLLKKFKPRGIDLSFMNTVVRFSVQDNGPRLVQNFLRQHGITLIIEPHFPQTYLDGATFMTANRESPVIGLTLRHNRLDNFWYTLVHELAHVALHFDQSINFFYDDLDRPDLVSKQEDQADDFASEALIPEQKWENSPARIIPSPIAAESLAKELGIHTAIVAGVMRHRGKNYKYLTEIVNHAKVRKYFPEKKWGK